MKVEDAYWGAGDSRVYVLAGGRLRWFMESVGRAVEPGDLQEAETPLDAGAFVKAKHLERVSDAVGGDALLRTWGLTKTTEAQRRAVRKYDDANTERVSLKLNKRTDADILERLGEVDSKQGYIKGLIRADMARGG